MSGFYFRVLSRLGPLEEVLMLNYFFTLVETSVDFAVRLPA